MIASSRFTLAIQTLMMVSNYNDRKITSAIVAASAGCNPVIVRKVFANLKDAGLLETSPGGGRTALKRRPEDISLWDVYLATESEDADDIFRMYDKGCPLGSGMHDVLRRHLEDAIDAMKVSLTRTSIADLSAELRGELGTIPSLDEILDYSSNHP